MKLVANIKLLPSAEDKEALKNTLEVSNMACNAISEMAWNSKYFGQFQIHRLAYRHTREEFSLSAQMAVRCIAKVASAYKTSKKTKCLFRKHSAQPYDDRIFRFIDADTISIWTTSGRRKIPIITGEYQRKLLKSRMGEVDLMFIRGEFYVACVCDIDDPKMIETTDVLGVDFGIVNIATDSTGECFSGDSIEANRRIFSNRRKNLQKKGTRAAKRKLKSIAGKQKRFQAWVNHNISKVIVAKAKTLHATIAIEDLKGIRDRVKAISRRQRARFTNWGFCQLRQFIEYKATLAGIKVVAVDPRYTSQTCPCCGVADKRNRPSRDRFSCKSCGHVGAADFIAARNIRAKAVVNQPLLTGYLATA